MVCKGPNVILGRNAIKYFWPNIYSDLSKAAASTIKAAKAIPAGPPEILDRLVGVSSIDADIVPSVVNSPSNLVPGVGGPPSDIVPSVHKSPESTNVGKSQESSESSVNLSHEYSENESGVTARVMVFKSFLMENKVSLRG